MLAGGSSPPLMSPGEETACHASARITNHADFLTVEGLGVDPPKRCKNCNNCKECSFKAAHLSWQENVELKAIEEGLSLDVKKKKWTAAYPYNSDPGILVDNYVQAKAMMKNLEKRLKKQSMLDDFNVQFKDTVDRGVFKEIEPECEYNGPINYITIVDAYKPGPHSTTPIRLCMNSSLKYAGHSLNDLLYKGPSALNDLYGVALGFRKHRIGFIKDLSKFYQSVNASARDQHLRRVLWRFGDEEASPKVYKTTTVNFGDKPAGCVAQVALRETAKMYRAIEPVAADVIINSTYCDDTPSGASTMEKAKYLSQKMDEIVAEGGFKYKDIIMTGDKPKEKEDGDRKVLGIGWNPEHDLLFVDAKINFSVKKKGIKVEPDVDPDLVAEEAPDVITKRMIWRVALGQYDLLGLVSPFLIRLKLIMRELSSEPADKKLWDSPVPDHVKQHFLEVITMLKEVKELRFPRCAVPEGFDQAAPPELMIVVDGSKSASCALVYGRWKMLDGTFKCRLMTGKTRVAPVKKISIPRMELQGAVAGVRLASKILEFSGIEFSKRHFFTDSTAVLGMLKGDMSTFQEFVGTRVSEIRSKSDAKTEWNWIPTDKNLADLGTRTGVLPKDLALGSVYQDGMPWMKDQQEAWPTVFQQGTVPEEEKLKSARVNAVTASKPTSLNLINKVESYNKLISVTSIIFLAAEKFKNKVKSKVLQVPSGKLFANIKSEANKYASQAEAYWFEQSQVDMMKDFHKDKYITLRPRLLSSNFPSQMGELIVVSGRLKDNLRVGYDKTELPVLEPSTKLAKMIMEEAHKKNHQGVDRTVQVSRMTAWIIRAGTLAKTIVKNCFFCKKLNKVVAGQIMAPIPEQRLPPTPPFTNTSVDMFGPFKIKDTVKRRTTRDSYGIIFCCMVTSAIHIEVTDDYGTDSALLAIRRFMSLRGTPSYIQSDPGTQVKAAGVQVQLWDCSKIREFAAGKRIKWHVISTAAQHCNGIAERMIGITKKTLYNIIKETSLTKGEIDTVFAEVTQLVNSRPLMVKQSPDPSSLGPITPNHLLSGRATMDVPVIQCSGNASLTRRLRFIEDLTQQFWKKWLVQVFPKLVPSQKWNTVERNLQEGDVVLLKDESKVSTSYKLGRVSKVIPSDDGKVRKVCVEYKNASADAALHKAPMMTTERSVHGLVVIVPADYNQDEIDRLITQDQKFQCLK